MSNVVQLKTKTQEAFARLKADMKAITADQIETDRRERTDEQRAQQRRQYRNLIALYSSKYRGIEGVTDEEVDGFLVQNLSVVRKIGE